MYSLGDFIAWLLDGAVGGLFLGEDARPQKYAIAGILGVVAMWLFVRGYRLHPTWTSRLWSGSFKWGAFFAVWALATVFFARRDPNHGKYW